MGGVLYCSAHYPKAKILYADLDFPCVLSFSTNQVKSKHDESTEIYLLWRTLEWKENQLQNSRLNVSTQKNRLIFVNYWKKKFYTLSQRKSLKYATKTLYFLTIRVYNMNIPLIQSKVNGR